VRQGGEGALIWTLDNPTPSAPLLSFFLISFLSPSIPNSQISIKKQVREMIRLRDKVGNNVREKVVFEGKILIPSARPPRLGPRRRREEEEELGRRSRRRVMELSNINGVQISAGTL